MKGFFLILLCWVGGTVCAQPQTGNAKLKNAQALLDSGISYYRQSEYDHALSLLHSAMEQVQGGGDTASQRVLIKCYNNIGNVYADKGNNPLSLENYQKALGIAEAIKDEQNAAHINKNIGALYISWQRLDEAIAYYKRSEQIALKLGDNKLLADCYNNEGTVYEQQQQYTLALDLYQKALAYYEKAKQPEGVAMALSNIAIIYKYQGDYPTALEYNKRSLEISRSIDDKWTVAATLNNIGNLYGERGEVAKAIDYCTQSIEIARHIDAMQIVIAAYESMASAAARTGDYKKAYSYFQSYASAKDSFISTESTRQLDELQVRYDTQKKQAENDQLRYENKLSLLARNKAQKETLFIICLAVVFVLFLLVVFRLVYRNRMTRAKAEEQQALNKVVYEIEQKERMRIARDLHDSIGQMMVVAKMQLMALPDEGRKQVAPTEQLLDDTIHEVRQISHNLIPEGLHFGLVRALEELCIKAGTANGTQVELQVAGDEADYTIGTEHALSIYRIVQEITGNMLKHADAPLITIGLHHTAASWVLQVSDTGKGFDTMLVKTSKGMGWKNIMARVSLLGGTIHIQSAKNKGTQIDIVIPR